MNYFRGAFSMDSLNLFGQIKIKKKYFCFGVQKSKNIDEEPSLKAKNVDLIMLIKKD